MNDLELLSEAISEVAELWIDPEYTSRVEAEKRLYDSSMRATPEAVAFAMNQQMPQLSASGISSLAKGRWRERPEKIGVFQRVDIPLGGLLEWVMVLIHGFEYVGVYEHEPNFLLKGFAEDVKSRFEGLRCSFQETPEDISVFSGVLALGVSDEKIDQLISYQELAAEYNLLVKSAQYSVALLDGKENKEEIEDLAEDVLMYEGAGESNVCIIWAPEELNPDPYFESFAFFRGVYPVHERTPGSLQMKKAFLAAQDMPHAYGEGLEFLVSRGDPECLEPCHIRWVSYTSKEEALEWIQGRTNDIRSLVIRSKLHNQVKTTVPKAVPGKVHRLSFSEYAHFPEIADFLASI